MNEERTIRSTLGDVRGDRTDWARVDALTDEEIEEAALADPDAQPTDEAFWKHAEIVTPPSKKDVHMRVDEDVLDWFKKQGRGYQTRMNAVLRAYMIAKSSSSEKRK